MKCLKLFEKDKPLILANKIFLLYLSIVITTGRLWNCLVLGVAQASACVFFNKPRVVEGG